MPLSESPLQLNVDPSVLCSWCSHPMLVVDPTVFEAQSGPDGTRPIGVVCEECSTWNLVQGLLTLVPFLISAAYLNSDQTLLQSGCVFGTSYIALWEFLGPFGRLVFLLLLMLRVLALLIKCGMKFPVDKNSGVIIKVVVVLFLPRFIVPFFTRASFAEGLLAECFLVMMFHSACMAFSSFLQRPLVLSGPKAPFHLLILECRYLVHRPHPQSGEIRARPRRWQKYPLSADERLRALRYAVCLGGERALVHVLDRCFKEDQWPQDWIDANEYMSLMRDTRVHANHQSLIVCMIRALKRVIKRRSTYMLRLLEMALNDQRSDVVHHLLDTRLIDPTYDRCRIIRQLLERGTHRSIAYVFDLSKEVLLSSMTTPDFVALMNERIYDCSSAILQYDKRVGSELAFALTYTTLRNEWKSQMTRGPDETIGRILNINHSTVYSTEAMKLRTRLLHDVNTKARPAIMELETLLTELCNLPTAVVRYEIFAFLFDYVEI